MGNNMKQMADIIAYDTNGKLTLVVEIKSKLGTSSQWAAKMRRNILAHGLLPSTPFFLLGLPDHFYLWKDNGIIPEVIMPTYEIEPGPFLQPYYEKSGLSLEIISGKSFELIVVSWLSEILGTSGQDFIQDSQKWLIESGLFEAIRGGHIDLGIPV